MIVLRISIAGVTQEHRLERRRTTLGSGRRANLRHKNAGWPERAGTLLVRGAQVLLEVPGRVGEVPLLPGQPFRLGQAEVLLVTAPLPPPPSFGDYDTLPETTPEPTADEGATPRAAESASATSAPHTARAGAPAPVPARSDPFGPRGDFDDELFQHLKRTPWFLASVVLHVLVALAFWVFTRPEARDLTSNVGRVTSAMIAEPERQSAGPEPMEELPSEEAEPVVPEVPIERPLQESTPSPLEQPEIEIGPLQLEEEPPSDLGTAPTLAAAGRRTAPKPSRPRPAPSIDLERTFAKDNMHDTRRQVAQHVRERLGVGRGGPGDALIALTADDLLVVQGEYDHQERVLRDLSIPYRSVAPTDPRFVTGEPLKKARFVFWNCGMPPSERLLDRLAPQLRAFVERGGYLFTSDWVVGHVLTRAFPEYVGTHGSAAALPQIVIDIHPVARHAEHRLLEGVFQPGVPGRWWLEARSLDVIVKKSDVVTVLIESPELKRDYRASSAVAVTFPHGQGRVLHVLGHYDQEEGNLAGVVAVQRIALNFILMSLSERPLK